MAEKQYISFDGKPKNKTMFIEEMMRAAPLMVSSCREFKAPRLERIQLYRNLYANNVRKKYRQTFNVVLPVFAGAVDTLQAAFNDDLSLEFVEQEPADYIAAKKVSSLWDMEVASNAPNAKFAYKCRTDRANAIFSGRGFLTNYGVSIPEFKNVFEVFELEDAIFQPEGGGHLESHLFCGRENIIRSAAQLTSGDYDQTAVTDLITFSAQSDYVPPGQDPNKEYLTKFKAAGLNPENSNYVGELLFNLVELCVTVWGTRYYLLFSPFYRKCVRFAPLTDYFSSGLYPYISWATHEDNKNFLSKSFADDMYGVAEATYTLVNQELTNREKKNYNARAFDKDMFPNVALLDQAQFRPDALVPANTNNGAKRISEGIFSFTTGDLSGTIDLVEYMNDELGRDIGVTDLAMGGVQQVSKKATVVFAEQQNISKRLMLRSAPYTEAMGEVGKLFIQSLKDHMPAKVALKRLGDEAPGFAPEITRIDLDTYSPLEVRTISSTLEMQNSQLKKEARMKTLNEIQLDPKLSAFVNPQEIVEAKLRDGAEYNDAEIAVLMDTKNYGNKEEVSYAHAGLREILNNKKPDLFYGATTLLQDIVYDYARNNRSKITNKQYLAMMDYVTAHNTIIQENLTRKASDVNAAASMNTLPGQQPAAPVAQPSPIQPQNDITATLQKAQSAVQNNAVGA